MEIKVLSQELISETLLDNVNKILAQLNPEQAYLTIERLKDISTQRHALRFLAHDEGKDGMCQMFVDGTPENGQRLRGPSRRFIGGTRPGKSDP
jgi:hypothetical protein